MIILDFSANYCLLLFLRRLLIVFVHFIGNAHFYKKKKQKFEGVLLINEVGIVVDFICRTYLIERQ